MARVFYYFDSKEIYTAGEVVRIEHNLLREPYVGSYYQRLSVENILVYLPRYPEYGYGDKLEIEGKIEINEAGIRLMWMPEVEAKNRNFVIEIARGFRERISEVVRRSLPDEEGALLLGIVFGIRDGFSREFYDSLRVTGVLHIVAASGANVVLVSGFVYAIFGRIMSRYVSVAIVAVTVLFYSLLSGLDASIMRASFMAILGFGGAIVGRQYDGLWALGIVGSIMILFDPGTVEDIGFWLSVSSTGGIIVVKPIFDMAAKKVTKFFLIEDLSTTLSASSINLPVLLWYFGEYSLIAPLTNVLVLWTVPILMVIGGIAALISVVIPILSLPFLYLLLPILKYDIWLIELLSPQSISVSIESIPAQIVLGYYIVIFAVIFYFRKNNKVLLADNMLEKR